VYPCGEEPGQLRIYDALNCQNGNRISAHNTSVKTVCLNQTGAKKHSYYDNNDNDNCLLVYLLARFIYKSGTMMATASAKGTIGACSPYFKTCEVMTWFSKLKIVYCY
jgi:hypothetical protein